MIRAVLLDLDGTLFDHRGSARRALDGWLTTLDVQPSDALAAAWFEAERVHHAAWARGEVTFAEQRRRRLRQFLPPIGQPVGDGDDLDAVFAGYADAYERAWTTFPDAADAVTALRRAGTGTAVLTNGTAEQQNAKVRACGLDGLVGPVLTSEGLGVAKPDAAVFHRACEHLGLAPREVVHVGDDHALEVAAARAAGLGAVHLDRGGHRGATGPHVITTLVDLPAALDALRR